MFVITLALLVTVVVVVVGLTILWSNSTRAVNRAVFVGAVQMAAWLLCWHFAATSKNGLYWIRWTCAVGALAPLTFWIVKECILYKPGRHWLNWLLRSSPWIVVPAVFAFLPFTDAFIPPESTAKNPIHGWAYGVYIWGLIAIYVVLFRDTFFRAKEVSGVERVELQVWLGGGCVLAVTVYALMGLSAFTGNPIFRRLQPLAVLLFYAGTAYAVTSFRIFDARQIFLVSIQRAILIVSVAVVAYFVQSSVELFVPKLFSFLITTAVALWLATILDSLLDRYFQFYPKAMFARKAAFSVAQRESRLEKLESAFLGVLKGWGQAETAMIVSGGKGTFAVDSTMGLDEDGLEFRAMKQLRWATPERLVRERGSPERDALREFLLQRRLGVVVIVEGTSLTSIVGVGIPASRRPYTYPQVTQLMELASIMESALERAHFSAKVQHTEQLATVGLLGASLAHEIRNPLVSIKTFVQLLPTHHQDPRFREKFFKLIGDEVGRIDQLTEQLLDLASPRTYEAKLIELHPLLRSSLDLVAAKAAHRNIEFLTEFNASPDAAFTDASAAKQVMLNLCFNAIQAVDEARGAPARWVKIATRNTPQGIEMAVADSGPGIAPEIRPRLFQPFQTTKSSGFGLGLAICSDILANLNATIAVDPPVPGQGAIFRVTFPCQPSLS